MHRLVLDELDHETVDALFVQAIAAHPPSASDRWSRRDQAVMMEFARLLTAELEGRLNARAATAQRRRAKAEHLAEQMRNAPPEAGLACAVSR